ncbi:hypothetical protein [Spirosoma pollinicola]|uniref:Uncharacterized protein n=1 Tax=Spirosoma pollinicola TaxID=2057025 RepID=A0A2K8YZ49_9BACT|nr:hypothetical protein [Spirosoma pollinicola]AUD02916.1 hypothetical protein CWM47_14390 [Spirosoma pollinicola]
MEFDRIKSILLALVPYVVLCSYIYFISFFQTFNLNGLAFINYNEILQITAYTFLITFGFSILINFILAVVMVDFLGYSSGRGSETRIGKIVNSKLFIFASLIIWVLIIYGIYPNQEESIFSGRWFVWGMAACFLPYLYLNSSDLLIEFRDSLRANIIHLIVVLPILSWSLGKYDSYRIKNNISYSFILENKIQKKIILLNSHSYIFCTMNNDSFFIEKPEKYNSVAIIQKK